MKRFAPRWQVESLHVVFGLATSPDALLARASTGAETVVLVDTIRSLLQLRDETDNSEVARRIGPWVAAARASAKTLLLLHHDRKGGGDHGEAIAGGHALLGAVDIGIEVVRDPSGVPTRRLIRTFARLIDSQELIYERTPEGEFHALGDPQRLKLDEVKSRVLLVLREDWQAAKEVQASLDEPRPSPEQLRQALLALGKDGAAERDPPLADGMARGTTHRWRAS